MKYRRLGGTGLFVSELSLGSATFGGGTKLYAGIGALPQEQVNELVRIAVEAGVNLIDTADVYSEGMAEEMVGQAIRDLGLRRDELLIATKVGDAMGTSPNSSGGSRYHIENAVEGSLRRLKLNHVDLYQLHDFDPATPIEETMEAMQNLVRRGLVRYVGVSNWAAWQIAVARSTSGTRETARCDFLQAYYSLAGRDIEREIVPALKHHAMGLMVWGPLAGGSLSGKYRTGTSGRRDKFDFPPVEEGRVSAILQVMDRMAARSGHAHAQIAIAWLLAQSHVTSVVLGATKPEQLRETLAARDVTIEPAELVELDLASDLPGEYPGWMQALKGAPRRALIHPR